MQQVALLLQWLARADPDFEITPLVRRGNIYVVPAAVLPRPLTSCLQETKPIPAKVRCDRKAGCDNHVCLIRCAHIVDILDTSIDVRCKKLRLGVRTRCVRSCKAEGKYYPGWIVASASRGIFFKATCAP